MMKAIGHFIKENCKCYAHHDHDNECVTNKLSEKPSTAVKFGSYKNQKFRIFISKIIW